VQSDNNGAPHQGVQTPWGQLVDFRSLIGLATVLPALPHKAGFDTSTDEITCKAGSVKEK
jgi:hypothetical protein